MDYCSCSDGLYMDCTDKYCSIVDGDHQSYEHCHYCSGRPKPIPIKQSRIQLLDLED